MKKLRFKFRISDVNFDNYKNCVDNKSINLINVNYNFKRAFDKISSKSNLYISNCFKVALKLLEREKFSGLINGPISKRYFLNEKFFGITEYLANKTKIKNDIAMLIFKKELSVCPVTTHLPLKLVHKQLSKKKIINKVLLIDRFYKKRFKMIPKIAITGLNPHCESNYKSSEEVNIISPAIKYLLKKKLNVKGPFPADTIFMRKQLKKFDVVVGMYHDQVLTPAKTLFEFKAINITLGLPFLRISPDHGPNEVMMGKNLSNPQSLIEALKFLDK